MSRRLAILVGNQNFAPDSGFATLRGPHNDVDALAVVLQDPARGDFTLPVPPLKDATRAQMLGLIERTLRAATPDDTVLIHYSGHGKPDDDGGLHFAAADTVVAELTTTGVPAEDVQRLARKSACRAIILLLDCCYAGAIGVAMNAGLKGDAADQVQQQLRRTALDARGLFILTSSTAWQTSQENEDERDGKVMGRFTRAVIERLTEDAPGQEEVRFSDLSDHVRAVFSGQDAREFRADAQGDPLIAHAPVRETPAQRRMRILSGWVRDGVVPESVVVPSFEAVEGKGALVELVHRLLDTEGMTPGVFAAIVQPSLPKTAPRSAARANDAPAKAAADERMQEQAAEAIASQKREADEARARPEAPRGTGETVAGSPEQSGAGASVTAVRRALERLIVLLRPVPPMTLQIGFCLAVVLGFAAGQIGSDEAITIASGATFLGVGGFYAFHRKWWVALLIGWCVSLGVDALALSTRANGFG